MIHVIRKLCLLPVRSTSSPPPPQNRGIVKTQEKRGGGRGDGGGRNYGDGAPQARRGGREGGGQGRGISSPNRRLPPPLPHFFSRSPHAPPKHTPVPPDGKPSEKSYKRRPRSHCQISNDFTILPSFPRLLKNLKASPCFAIFSNKSKKAITMSSMQLFKDVIVSEIPDSYAKASLGRNSSNIHSFALAR